MRTEATVLLNVVLILVLLGAVMVYSAGTVQMYKGKSLDSSARFAFLQSQLIHAAVGLGALVFAARFDYHKFQGRRLLWTVVGVTTLLLVLVLFLGENVNGARRWFLIFGHSFQPSELAKFSVIVLLAVKLSENQTELKDFRKGYLPPMIILAFFVGLVFLENDLGTPIVLGAVGLLMCLMAGVWWRYIAGTFAAGGVLVLLACRLTWRWERILAWWDPIAYQERRGYHLVQSLEAFAQGHLWGVGLGASQQKLQYLPAAHSDFIFAIWGEEMGLVGTLTIVILFALFLIMAMRIALCARDLLGTLLAGGIATLIIFQALFNMAVTTGILPTKGLPLPLLSAGGTALVLNLAMVGVLLNVASQAKEREARMAASAAS